MRRKKVNRNFHVDLKPAQYKRIDAWAESDDKEPSVAVAWTTLSVLLRLFSQDRKLLDRPPFLLWLFKGANTRTRWQRLGGMEHHCHILRNMLGHMIIERLDRDGGLE